MMVSVSRVRKTYPAPAGGVPVRLSVPRFEVERGDSVVITGPSGSGKTTLLNIIAGIIVPDEGDVTVDGVRVTDLSEAARDRFRARRVGYVFQTFNLLPGFTALENVTLAMVFAGRVDAARARALLHRVGLSDRLTHRPDALSVGQQQRVAIARALANEPAVLLADEPTGNVDPAAGQSIIELLKEVCRESQVTLILVTHQPEVVRSFRRVVDLRDLVEAGA